MDEKEIMEAAGAFAKKYTTPYTLVTIERAFIDGAKWFDENLDYDKACEEHYGHFGT